jgi:hypothetical protein
MPTTKVSDRIYLLDNCTYLVLVDLDRENYFLDDRLSSSVTQVDAIDMTGGFRSKSSGFLVSIIDRAVWAKINILQICGDLYCHYWGNCLILNP